MRRKPRSLDHSGVFALPSLAYNIFSCLTAL
nr:MAG TPA: hypothetical protein [Caudoviricetes sp.]